MTMRLVRMGLEGFSTLDGYVAAHGGGDPLELPLRRFCNLVWWLATRNREQADVDKLEANLWTPPAGERGRGPWAPDAELAGLSALNTALGSANSGPR